MTLRARRHLHFHVATLTAAALAMALGAIPHDAEGRPGGGRGGGGRGAAMSIQRGGGMAARPAVGMRPSAGQRPSTGSRPGAGSRPEMGGRPASGNRPATGAGGSINSGNRGGDRINTRDVNIGNDVNIDVDRGWDNNGWNYHPVAAGIAFGAAAAVTSAVVGSTIYSLPPSCSTVYYSGVSYAQCGNVWYEPRYAGSSVNYIVVNPPY